MKKLFLSSVLTSTYLVIGTVVGTYFVVKGFSHLETHPVWAASLFVFATLIVSLNAYSFYRELPLVRSEVRRVRRERRQRD